MKKHFACAVTALTLATSSMAQDLTVLQLGASGAIADLYSTIMTAHLNNNGWDATKKVFSDCKGAEAWVRANPNKPVMYTAWSDDVVLATTNPEHPRSCPGLTVTKDTLVTPINKSNHMVCGRGDLTLDDFRKTKSKVGIWNHPVQVKMAEDLIGKDLKLEHRIVGFARGADLVQALVSKDVDYIVVSSENLIRNIKGTCFLTTANPSHAAKMSDLKTDKPQVSTESIAQSLTRTDTGLVPLYVAYNVDTSKLRADVKKILLSAPEYKDLWTTVNQKAGVVAGQTPDEQWANFSSFVKSFTK